MFGKQVVELCTIATYWVIFVPSLLVWLKLEINGKPFDYFFEHSDYVLYLILGYLAIYRIMIYLFIILKSQNLRLWYTLPKTQAKLDMELAQAKSSSCRSVDQLDAPPAILKYSGCHREKKATFLPEVLVIN